MKMFFSCLLLISAVGMSAQTQSLADSLVQVGGVWEFQVDNASEASVTALSASWSCSGGAQKDALLQMDTLLNYGHDKSIGPGKSSTDPLPVRGRRCPGTIDAALFSDGHAEGNPEAIAAIYARRAGAYKAIPTIVNALHAIVTQTSTPQAVGSELQKHMSNLSHDNSVDPAERAGGMFAYSAIQSILLSNADWLVPSDSTPVHQPQIPEVMASANISHEQAQATVIAKKLQEWTNDLEANLQPSIPLTSHRFR